MSAVIYKIATQYDWEAAKTKGHYDGAPIDHEDGFIHFSTAEQLRETASKHFAGQNNLLLVSVDGEKLGADLKFEPSRGGDLFPHLYAPLEFSAVIDVISLPLGDDGIHVFPNNIS